MPDRIPNSEAPDFDVLTSPTAGESRYTEDASPVPVRIGRYHVRRLIGSGGMGAVYLAEQAQPKRLVALKLIRQAFAGESGRVRFQQEAQHLAILDHPSIAKVYEAGAQAQEIGGPIAYIAMEFVPGGEALTRYALKHKLPLDERLTLFAIACDALQHAHERGIVHRDIKPGNVLVSEAGQVKVIDFGVARAEMVDGERRPNVTLDGQMIGTREYMAPEQCIADPADPTAIDARADVYALGLLLYELVVGALPYDISRANIPTAIAIIREQAPALPRRQRPGLPREVETIILKALRKEREERYASAAALAADVRRYLTDEAIEAEPEGIASKAARWVRKAWGRRPVLTALAIIALASLASWVLVLPLTTRTPLYSNYTSLLARVTPNPGAGAADQLAIIAITESLGDGTALAEKLGLSNFDPGVKQSRRLLHAELMDRLGPVGPRVLAYDLYFPKESVYDDRFAESMRALKERGVPIVVATNTWRLDEDDQPAVTPKVRKHARWGAATAPNAAESTYAMDMVVVPKAGLARYSWPLQVFAAARNPKAPAEYLIRDGTELQVAWPSRDRGSEVDYGMQRPAELIPIAGGAAATADLPEGGLCYAYGYQPLGPALVARHTYAYEQVFEWSPEELRQRLGGKVVIVADFTNPGDAMRGPDGQDHPGATFHFGAIASLLAGTPVAMVNDLSWVVASAVVMACLGFIAALGLRRVPTIPRTVMILFGLTILVGGVSLVLYQGPRLVLEPFTPLVAGLLAFLFAACLRVARPVPRLA